MIFIDSREAAKCREISDMLLGSLGQQVAVRKLEVGDYLLDGIEGVAVVERKTITDLLNSMKPDESGRGRIWSQLDQLSEIDSCEKILLVEGWMGLVRKLTQWDEASIYRLVESIQRSYTIPVIHTADWRGTALYLIAKYKSLQERREPRDLRLRASSASMAIEEQALYVVEGLPRIGPALAKALLKTYGSVKGVIDALATKPPTIIRDEVARVLGRRPPEPVIEHAREVILKHVEII
ncbi:MAG: ERCC4 domain-containing protein [Nitrososphaerota archaeon]|nr:ERCC4 domain-containing protein [Nitrososphaerota archaeon]